MQMDDIKFPQEIRVRRLASSLTTLVVPVPRDAESFRRSVPGILSFSQSLLNLAIQEVIRTVLWSDV